MERSFRLGNFFVIKGALLEVLGLPEYHCIIHFCIHVLVPCSLVKYAVYFPNLQVERSVPFDFSTGTTVFSIQMESAPKLYYSTVR